VDVIFHSIKTKAIPYPINATDAMCLHRSEINSMDMMDFTIVPFAMKILKCSNKDMVLECSSLFGFELPSQCLIKRRCRFDLKF
jgi:hypothetical protein